MPDTTPAERLRAEADAADLLTFITRCASIRRTAKEEVITSTYGLKESRHEPGLRARCTLAQEGGLPLAAPRDHQVVRLREAPLDADGMPQPLLLDGERLAVLMVLAEMGRAVPGKADGDELAVMAFKPYVGDDDAPPIKGALTLRYEGAWLLERFTLGQVYRLAVLPPPAWLEEHEAAAAAGVDADQVVLPGLGAREAEVRLADGDLEGSLLGTVAAEAAQSHADLAALAVRREEAADGGLTYWVSERDRRAARDAISGAAIRAGELLKGVGRGA